MLRNTRLTGRCLPAIASLCLFTVPALAQRNTTPFTGCGTLTIGVECPMFVGDEGTSFSITNIGEHAIGDHVLVTGTICHDCPSICQQGAVFITEDIGSCFTIPPHKFVFSECGTLVLTGEPGVCLLFQSETSGLLYGIENTGDFGIGDFVRASGTQVVNCKTFCTANVEACLLDNDIQPCIAPPLAVDTCGTLVQHPIGNPICTVFQGDDGDAWLLSDQGNFEVGDRVHITGPAFFCTPICGDVVGCVLNAPPVGCFGDVNNDGGIDVDDLLAVISHWGPCPKCAEDLDGNGAVDVDDMLAVIANWHAG